MKVTEICGYLDDSRGFPEDYIAYYYTKIENRNVIFRRVIDLWRETRGPTVWERLEDSITAYDLR